MQIDSRSSTLAASSLLRLGATGRADRALGRFRRASLRRILLALLLLSLAQAVTALMICDAHCIAQALSDDEGAGNSHAQGAAGDCGVHACGNDPLEPGPCHLLGTSAPGASAVAFPGLGLATDGWSPGAIRAFASIAWPPPRPRPKPAGS